MTTTHSSPAIARHANGVTFTPRAVGPFARMLGYVMFADGSARMTTEITETAVTVKGTADDIARLLCNIDDAIAANLSNSFGRILADNLRA